MYIVYDIVWYKYHTGMHISYMCMYVHIHVVKVHTKLELESYINNFMNLPLSAVADWSFGTKVLSMSTPSTSPECFATVKVTRMPLLSRT